MFIVTNRPSVSMYYKWTIKDSMDGKIYLNFEDALQTCFKIGGCGVARI